MLYEAGHALVARMLPHADPVHKISIVARGMSLGQTFQLPAEDRYLFSKAQLQDMLASSLGGRVAEEMVFRDVTTGAADDLEKATSLARGMVTRYAMSNGLGPRTFGRKEELVFLGREISEQRNYGDKVADEIDQQVQALILSAYQAAKYILSRNRAKLEQIARRLIAEETIEGETLAQLFQEAVPQPAS